MSQGLYRSCIKSYGCVQSEKVEPFYTLQLDIQSSNTKTLTDAFLATFTTEELLQDFRVKCLYLEKLPPVMFILVKRFVYKDGTQRKVMKQLKFDTEFTVPETALSPLCQSSTMHLHRQYSLSSVITHIGTVSQNQHS